MLLSWIFKAEWRNFFFIKSFNQRFVENGKTCIFKIILHKMSLYLRLFNVSWLWLRNQVAIMILRYTKFNFVSCLRERSWKFKFQIHYELHWRQLVNQNLIVANVTTSIYMTYGSLISSASTKHSYLCSKIKIIISTVWFLMAREMELIPMVLFC